MAVDLGRASYVGDVAIAPDPSQRASAVARECHARLQRARRAQG